MPIYLFRTEDGELVEHHFPSRKAPRIGKTVMIGGQRCTRAPSFRVGTAPESKSNYPYLSNSLPRTTKGCKMKADPKTGRKKPLIESRRHEREVMAKNDLVKESATFDGGDY
jgi:hypothetical protein